MTIIITVTFTFVAEARDFAFLKRKFYFMLRKHTFIQKQYLITIFTHLNPFNSMIFSMPEIWDHVTAILLKTFIFKILLFYLPCVVFVIVSVLSSFILDQLISLIEYATFHKTFYHKFKFTDLFFFCFLKPRVQTLQFIR